MRLERAERRDGFVLWVHSWYRIEEKDMLCPLILLGALVSDELVLLFRSHPADGRNLRFMKLSDKTCISHPFDPDEY